MSEELKNEKQTIQEIESGDLQQLVELKETIAEQK